MKIAIISPRLENSFSGAENYIVSLAHHLSEKNEVHIITKKNNGVYPNLGNINMHYIEGIGSGSVELLKALPNLKNTLDEIKPDVVHMHCFISLFLYSGIIESNKYKVIVTVHSTPHGDGKLFSWFDGIDNQRSFIKIMYDKVKPNATIFGSNYYMEEYTKAVPKIKEVSKCYINPYYSDIDEITIEERMKMKKNDELRILFPSRIVKRKGIEETLYLLKKLPENYILDLPAMAQMEYQNYNEKVLKLIKDLKLESRVKYPKEKVIGTQMYDYYKNADLVLIPSYFEGFGIVAVEAMNSSVPVITTGVGGLKEIIVNDYNGIIMDINDLEDTKNKILNITNNEKQKVKLLTNAKKTINEKYNKERHMNMIDDIYSNL